MTIRERKSPEAGHGKGSRNIERLKVLLRGLKLNHHSFGTAESGEAAESDFQFAPSPVTHSGSQIKSHQMISILPEKLGTQFAAIVSKAAPEEITLELVSPPSDQWFHQEDQVRIKYWDSEQAFYFDCKILKCFGANNQHLIISSPCEGIARQRRKSYRVHGPIAFSFTVIAAADSRIVDKVATDAEAKNLSAGGLAFETDHPLKSNDRLELNLHLPPGQDINAVAQVLRSAPIGQQGQPAYLVAMKFLQLTVEAQNQLLLFVAQSRPCNETSDVMWVG